MVIVEVVSTLTAGLLGSIGGYEYRRRRERDRKQRNVTEAWFGDCLDVIGRGAYNIEQARFGGEPDYDRILEDVDSFSERLFVQVRDPPDGVSDSTVETVSAVAQMYAKATAVADVNTRKEGIEVVVELFEMAQEEYSEELDFEDALHDATELSTGFDQMMGMVENQGIETSELAATLEEILSEWDTDDFEQFMIGAGEQGGNIERTIDQVMGFFFALANNLSNSAYKELQAERDRVIS
jgi:hypothetical protein